MVQKSQQAQNIWETLRTYYTARDKTDFMVRDWTESTVTMREEVVAKPTFLSGTFTWKGNLGVAGFSKWVWI